MSRPRFDWWPYVKGMIRRYPALCEEYANLHSQSVTADYSGMPRGGGGGRGLESLAIRELPSTRQREYEAVRRAVEATERYRRGRDRIEIVRLVLWKGTHTIAGAAMTIPRCSEDTAKDWHREFIYLVASFYGLMDE